MRLHKRWVYIKVLYIGIFRNGRYESGKDCGGQCSFTINGILSYNLINCRIAHSLGRPSHINTNDWNVPPLIKSDFYDDDGPDDDGPLFTNLSEQERITKTTGVELFVNMASLTMILSDTLESL